MKNQYYSTFNFNENSARVFSTFLEASDLEEFILGVADVIKKPLIVVDNVFKVLAASSTEGVDDPVWCQAVEQGYYSDELVLQILVQSSTRDVLIDNHDPVERGPLLSRYKRIVSRLIFGGKAYGSLVVLCTDEENQQELLELMPFIKELFNISLTDMESVYRILNSCRLIKYMEAIAENKSLRRSSDLSSATMLNIKGYGGDTTT